MQKSCNDAVVGSVILFSSILENLAVYNLNMKIKIAELQLMVLRKIYK